MKISNKVREKYTQICHKSTAKCNTYADIDYRIVRAIHLGTLLITHEGEQIYGYYRLRFVVKKNTVINMYDSIIGEVIEINEYVKNEYDRIHMKLVV
jgi:hypothetical protein